MTVVRFVDVRDRSLEVARATADGDTVTYEGGETAAAVVEQTVRDHQLTAVEAVELLAQDGWSNGYIMVDLT